MKFLSLYPQHTRRRKRQIWKRRSHSLLHSDALDQNQSICLECLLRCYRSITVYQECTLTYCRCQKHWCTRLKIYTRKYSDWSRVWGILWHHNFFYLAVILEELWKISQPFYYYHIEATLGRRYVTFYLRVWSTCLEYYFQNFTWLPNKWLA